MAETPEDSLLAFGIGSDSLEVDALHQPHAAFSLMDSETTDGSTTYDGGNNQRSLSSSAISTTVANNTEDTMVQPITTLPVPLSRSSSVQSRIPSVISSTAGTAVDSKRAPGPNTVKATSQGLRLSTFEPASTISHVASTVSVQNSSRPASVFNLAVPNRGPPLEKSIPIAINRHPQSSQHRFEDDNMSQMSTSSLATSFSKSFLFGFLNNKQKDNKSGGLISKEYWMKDETSTECFICSRLFTTFRRKHHCRICGQIFCSACTTLISGEKFNHNGKMRVCKTCLSFANEYNDSSDESSFVDESFVDNRTYSQDQDQNSIHPSTPVEEKPFLAAPTPPPRMAIPATRKGESVEIPISRSLNSRISSLHTSNFGRRKTFNRQDQHPPFYRADDTQISYHNYTPKAQSSGRTQTETSFADYVKTHGVGGVFNFNSDANNHQVEPTSPSHQYSDSEDENSMSIYTALNLDRSDVNDSAATEGKARLSRSNTRSMERAQASLYRMRNRRKSKSSSKPQVQKSPGFTPDYNTSGISYSSPILNSPTLNVVIQDSPLQQKFKSELNAVCEKHFKNMLDQSLADEEVPDVQKWADVLSPVLHQLENIEYNVKAGDSMDIRQYIKLKRLRGGRPSDTMAVNGVVFSKTLALKTMPRHISNPRIALIMFPLEYMKTGQHFMSLEPIINQEKEYIHKLVGRILALSPDVVFVGASVSGLALKLLDDASVAVAYNFKPQVIERIARMTQADIVTSMDKLALNLRLGVCQALDVKTYAYRNITKTMIFLTGCDHRLGSIILLRGGDDELLRKVKESTEFMLYTLCNLRLESAFYRDNFIYLSQDFYNKMLESEETEESDEMYGSEFLQALRKRLLSVSPTVQFEPPFLLTRARETEKKLVAVKLNKTAIESGGDIVLNEALEEAKTFLDSLKTSGKESMRIINYVMDKKMELLEEGFNIRARQWELFSSFSPNMLDPQNHQSLAFLYSMVCTKTSTPCIGPMTLQIDFYWDNDMTLGQYVEHLISSANGICTEGCGDVQKDHYRTYVHGDGKLDIFIEPFMTRIPIVPNVILTWSYCKKCGHTSPFLPMSDTTWKFSFGKFLELVFWSKKNSSTNLGNCSHDFAKDHIKYFTLNDLTVRMEYSKVDLLELIVPTTKLLWKPQTNVEFKIDLHSQVIEKSQRFFSSVLARLTRVKVDSISNDKMEAGQERIEQLKEKVASQQQEVKEKIEQIYNSTDPGDHLPLNSVLRFVQDISVEWDLEFARFEANYLPSEKDITRITTQQLRKLFLDNNDEKGDEADSDTKSVFSESSEIIKEKKSEVKDITARKSSVGSSVTDYRASPKGKVLEEVNKFEKMMSEHEMDAKKLSAPELKAKSGAATPTRPSKLRQLSGEPLKLPRTPSFEKSEYVLGSRQASENDVVNNKLKSRLGISTKDLELQLKEGRQKSFSTISSGGASKSENVKEDSKVMKLTNYFDQIHFETLSKEFEMRREKERLKLIQNRYKAVPIASSKPIVEIYKSVKDAVNEDEADDMKSNIATKPTENHEPEEKSDSHGLEIGMKEDSLKGDIPQTERVSLMKTLANFWADRSATLWKPLEYPLSSSEHIFADSDVVIREDEPSSLIAFCLSSSDYIQKYHSFREGNTENLESIMLKKTSMHLKYQFQDGDTQLSCKIFFAEQFEAFRDKCGLNDSFVKSLSRCVKWNSAGGKSGSAFLKTLDDRFVIKELSASELDSFVNFSQSYFEYMAQALFHDLPTVIAKIFGFYQIYMKNPYTGKTIKIDVLIMENLFYQRKNLRIFDLKGSMRNRHVEQTGKENEVLLDENMVEYIYESPLFVRQYAKKLLRSSLWNDTIFLSKVNVMDYSLVIGIDDENKTLTVGIIDCIRTFTWDKKLESWVKEKGLVGGRTKEPTVVTPRQYKNRFREAMDRYILMVPDCWYQNPGQ
jgi:1-phosphatidylinositol-3-phosphate 5-kinase